MSGGGRAGRGAAAHATAVLAGLLGLAPLACDGPAPVGAASAATAVAAAPPGGREGPRIAALGRLEPKDGILRIAGPSRPSVVVAVLFVEEGDRVRAGDPIAELDTRNLDAARVARAEAELADARAEVARARELSGRGVATQAALEDARLALDVARARLRAAHATLAMNTVRAPVAGQVLRILAREGERVGPQGIVELAQNQQMYAIAEVYETDVRRIRPGQRAEVRSPAFADPLQGTVERVGLQIGKLDTLDTDPVAAIDARVVEVHVRLDESARAASLANLQVHVAIDGASHRADAP